MDAGLIFSSGNAHQRRIYIPDFLDMPVNTRQLQIDQQVRYRCLTDIVYTTGEINEVLFVRLQQFKPYFLPQLIEAVVQFLFEIVNMVFSQHD